MTILEKHNIILKGNERFYIENLNERDFVLEGATPVYLLIDDKYISERSWIGIIPKLAIFLQSKNTKTKQELLNYRTEWTKSQIFSEDKRINFKPVFDGLYINTNMTAVHSVWLIQDLLLLFGEDISKVTLLIKRPPSIEPKEVRDYVKSEIKMHFADYLRAKKMDQESITKVISGIETMNKYLAKISKPYCDFYLLDNTYTIANYKSRFIKDCSKYVNWTEKQMLLVKKYLDLFTSFCGKYFRS